MAQIELYSLVGLTQSYIAKNYAAALIDKNKVAEPLVNRLKKLIKDLLVRYFKVVDNANNSVLKNYRITNIDKSAPELTISGNLSTPTSKVKLIAKASDNSGNFVLQYSFDRQQWSDGASLELTENCTVYFRATDNAGNETVKTLLISNIDPSAPDKSTVSADITTPTGSAVTVTMLFDINAVFREYSLDGKNYLPYPENGVVMTQNGTVYFRGIDQVGNI